MRFLHEYHEIFGLETELSREVEAKVRGRIANKKPGDPDCPEVLSIKADPQAEANAAAQSAGFLRTKCIFEPAVYQTGKGRKASRPNADSDIIRRFNAAIASGPDLRRARLVGSHGIGVGAAVGNGRIGWCRID